MSRLAKLQKKGVRDGRGSWSYCVARLVSTLDLDNGRYIAYGPCPEVQEEDHPCQG